MHMSLSAFYTNSFVVLVFNLKDIGLFLWYLFMLMKKYALSSVQSLSCVQLFVNPWIAARQPSLSITNS